MINLPRKDEQDNNYISYSQIRLWQEAKGFNTGMSGRKEFIRGYFLGEEYPDKGDYGAFGKEVEAYITERTYADKFHEDELVTLDQIVPLGVFQHEIKIKFEGFYLKGFIDDMTRARTKLRDYKTASLASSEKYRKDDYYQLDVYALAILEELGYIPELEVCVIERMGNGFRGGRNALTVGQNIWYIQRETSLERLATLSESIAQTAQEISQYYQIFLKLNK